LRGEPFGVFTIASKIRVVVVEEAGIFSHDTLSLLADLERSLVEIDGVRESTSPLTIAVLGGTDGALELGPAAPGGEVPATNEEMGDLQRTLQAIPSGVVSVVSPDGQAGVIVLELAYGTDRASVLLALNELLAPLREAGHDISVYTEKPLTEDSDVELQDNVFDEHFAGSVQLVVEIDTGQQDGLKGAGVLNDLLTFETFLRQLGFGAVRSIADLVCELNEHLNGGDSAFLTVPDSETLISQLLLLYRFQGGDVNRYALPDDSSGIVTGMLRFTTDEDAVCTASVVARSLENFFVYPLQARNLCVLRLIPWVPE